MLGQTFDFLDLPRVFVLIFIEIFFSADNAVSLGLFASSLPGHQRKKALFIGFASAIIFRGAALLACSFLFKFLWIQALGALFLIYLSVRGWRKTKIAALNPQARTFWQTVFLIETFDLIFAIDSIIAGLSFIAAIPSHTTIHPKLWIVYLGAILGMAAIRFAAKFFSDLIEKFPKMEKSAYLMIGWVGCKLLIPFTAHYFGLDLQIVFEPIFWTVLVALFILGLRKQVTHD